jgi:WD40 repeat protein
MDFTRDSKYLFTGAAENIVQWDIKKMKVYRKYEVDGAEKCTYCMKLSLDNKWLYSSSGRETVYLQQWNIETGKLHRKIEVGQNDHILSMY